MKGWILGAIIRNANLAIFAKDTVYKCTVNGGYTNSQDPCAEDAKPITVIHPVTLTSDTASAVALIDQCVVNFKRVDI